MKYRKFLGKVLRCFLTLVAFWLIEDKYLFIHSKKIPNTPKQDRSYKVLGKITIKETKMVRGHLILDL